MGGLLGRQSPRSPFSEEDICGMRLFAVIAGFAVLAGNGPKRYLRLADPETVWRKDTYKKFRVEGLLAQQRGDLAAAIEKNAAGAAAAERDGNSICQGRFLANLATAYLLDRSNQKAIRALLAGRTAAEAAGDVSTIQTIEANLANLYVQTGDAEAATAAARRGSAIRIASQPADVRVPILLAFGRAMAKTQGLEAAEPLFREGLQAAAMAGSLSLEAEILDLWGHEALESEQYARAEDLLARAWYARKTVGDLGLPITEGKLARLYRKTSNFRAARRWMDRVLAARAGGSRIPVAEWSLLAEQGHVSAGEGRMREALASYRDALGWARRWRDALPPADRLRAGAERRMVELFEGHLRAAGELYLAERDPQLAMEMFALIQTTRAWSMEKSADADTRSDRLYARARRLESGWLGGNEAAGRELKLLRAAILEREAESRHGAGSEGESRMDPPGDGEAVLTYWLDGQRSWLWVWTKRGLQTTLLPGRERIVAAAGKFRAAIGRGESGQENGGEELLSLLLGDLRKECLAAKRWDIVADAGLFQIPFGALPAGNGQYVAEQIEVRLIPNALRRPEPEGGTRRLLAVADPIFNRADERWQQPSLWQRLFPAAAATPLPRLPGTRREAHASLAIWRKAGFETALQLGAESSEEAVLARLREWTPAIVHIATHTVTPQGESERPRLALSLRPDGSAGLLSAEDIAALSVHPELVVLSACQSAGGEPPKGSALFGLTRAWLTAGSHQVLATIWPVSDDATGFFETFYSELARGAKNSPLPVAAAMRRAQIACIRGGGLPAQPRNWAGHVLLARR